MDPSSPRRVRELFDAALERNADQRAAFLEIQCAGHPQLKREVEALLEQHQHALESDFLGRFPAILQQTASADTHLHLTCPRCHADLQFPPDSSEDMIRCPHCGATGIVPTFQPNADFTSDPTPLTIDFHPTHHADHTHHTARSTEHDTDQHTHPDPPTQPASDPHTGETVELTLSAASSLHTTPPAPTSSSTPTPTAGDPAPDLTQHEPSPTTLPDHPASAAAEDLRFPEISRADQDLFAQARFRILEKVGEGGMAIVFRGRETDLGRELAVKILRKKHQHRSDLINHFIVESQICSQLQHPGIVPVHHIGTLHDKRPYFTMKLVKGVNLHTLLNDREKSSAFQQADTEPASDPPADPDTPTQLAPPAAADIPFGQRPDLPRFLAIFEQIAQTIGFAHSHDVINRDIKPSNVMVGEFGEVLVMDWGFAKVLNQPAPVPWSAAGDHPAAPPQIVTRRSRSDGSTEFSRPGSVKGTLAFMAREQARGENHLVHKPADVFALGSMLCQILTGQPAYTGNSIHVLLRKAVQADLKDAYDRLEKSQADPELIALARDCLNPDPAQRPANASIVAERMAAYTAAVRQKLHQAEIDSAAATARAQEALATAREADARAAAERAHAQEAARAAREANARAAAERKSRRLQNGIAAAIVLLAASAASGYAWFQNARNQRIAQSSLLVMNSLNEAERQKAAALAASPPATEAWRAARDAAQQAHTIAMREPISPALSTTAANLWEELKTRYTEAQNLAQRLEIDHALLATLETIRGHRAEHASPALTDAEYTAAFSSAGIDFQNTDPATLGRAIAQRTLPIELAAHLDEWARVRRMTDTPPDAWKALVAAARTADPDPARNTLRALFLNPGPPDQAMSSLRQLAQDDAALARLQPPTCILLARLTESLTQDRDPARLLLERAARQFPNDFWIRIVLAELIGQDSRHPRVRYPRPHEVIPHLTAAIALRPSSSIAHNNLGVALVARDDLPAARAEFEQAVALRPGDALALANLANALHELGRHKDAEAAALRATQIDPNDPISQNNLGLALAGQKRDAEAQAAYQRAIALDPRSATPWINLGKLQLDQKRQTDAQASFDQAIQLEPNSPLIRFNLGNALREAKQYDAAIAAYTRAAELDPTDLAPLVNHAEILIAQNKLDQAKALIDQALLIDPRSALARNAHGRFLARKAAQTSSTTLFQKAESELELATQLEPRSALFWYHLGRLRYELAQTQGSLAKLRQAAAAFRTALSINPDHADAHYNLSLILHHHLSDLPNALQHGRAAVNASPRHVDALLHLGMLLQQDHQWAESITHAQTAVGLEPENPSALNNLAWALAVAPDPQLRKPQAALQHASHAVKLRPDDAINRCTLALAEYRNQQLEKALQSLARSRALGPVPPYEDFIESLVRHHLSQPEAALKAFHNAVQFMREHEPREADLHILWTESAQLLGQPGPP